jgi:hypothetical protein
MSCLIVALNEIILSLAERSHPAREKPKICQKMTKAAARAVMKYHSLCRISIGLP